ncbi:glycosyltransferase family 39 protein [Rhizobium sp.]|jgi:lipid A galacturonosyltransferase RgtD|uniref:ArnT family glycosyltransferase n=1 Tax=Rhizobium sp. TaxID=391 RepID=UPI002AA75810
MIRMTLRTSIVLILTITVFRLVMLRYDTTDLFVDEAQYWLWSQHLDFGYYSKPPMIAWVIHFFTTLGGSQDIFWVRAASPVLHMITALLLIPAAMRLTGSRLAGYWSGVSYATLPGVALSSIFMSTDTILFPFMALTLLCYSYLIERRSIGLALLMGVSIGFGTLSKYAMLYFAATALISAIFLPKTRIALRDTALAILGAAVVIAPNVWWNATHGGATLKHTSDNADWHGLHFNIGEAASFLGAQAGVIGPVLFIAMLVVLYRLIRGKTSTVENNLFILSWPIVLVIVVQALMSHAYANWAATAYAAGVILAVFHLLQSKPRLLTTSLIINGVTSIIFPFLGVYSHEVLLPGGKPVLSRYLGRADMSWNIAATAGRAGTATIVAESRDILADLFYTLRDEPFTIRARSNGDFPNNYYEQEFALTSASGDEPVLYITGNNVSCNGTMVDPVADLTPRSGYLKGTKVKAYVVPASCLTNRLT